jgi:hypothetical protein
LAAVNQVGCWWSSSSTGCRHAYTVRHCLCTISKSARSMQ